MSSDLFGFLILKVKGYIFHSQVTLNLRHYFKGKGSGYNLSPPQAWGHDWSSEMAKRRVGFLYLEKQDVIRGSTAGEHNEREVLCKNCLRFMSRSWLYWCIIFFKISILTSNIKNDTYALYVKSQGDCLQLVSKIFPSILQKMVSSIIAR